ncbi:PHD finger family protein [Striga hermonthica]|uniref:PHD finger family protein n=1 Tax=Striga hermonthica TaxID=68872 RepID=A0A9N7R3U7_STRHE|nr:PHD finger family protein [Striga hermonthica]
MNGGGRRQRRRKSMAGCRGAAEPEKTDDNCDSPNLDSEITGKPSGFPDITKLPPKSEAELDLYTQARKALALRSPFDSEDSQATPACVSAVSSRPGGVSHLLGRHSDSRKRHKKLHLGSEKKSSATGKARGSNIWVETEEYFRELAIEDVERLDGFSCSGFSSDDKCFSIPYLVSDDNQHVYFDTCNRMLMNASDKDSVDLEKCVELKSNGNLKIDERTAEKANMAASIDVGGDEVATDEFQMKEDSNEGKRVNSETDSTSFNGVEWLLGSRSKVYLASERPSKKRKLLGKDAGLEKLLVAHPVEGLESVCHYCSNGDMGDTLNLLIKCSSCGMVVHQRCYGVQGDVDSSWLCSWCKWKNVVELSKATPCMLCPKQGGALKPVQKRGFGSEYGRSMVEFAHLFCCLWIPEVYLENTRDMEPIMNVDGLKETRRKLICHLCKVKHGACIRCTYGSCRMSFHPICAREARHRMEIWGQLGYDEVELRAYCTKHSEVQCDSGTQNAEDVSLTADLDVKKLNDIVLDGEDLLYSGSHPEYGDPMHPDGRNGNEDVNTCGVFSFPMMLKKLIDLGKVSSEGVASEIGVSLDSLDNILTDNQIVPELQCKLLRWLKNHVQIGNIQKTMKAKVRSLVAPNDVAVVAEGGDAVPVEFNISDSVPVKSVPPRRRTKSSIRTVKDETNEGYVDSCVHVGEDSNDPSGESLSDGTKKILVDYEQHQDDSVENSIEIEDELRALVQFLSEDGLHEERTQSQQMTSFSPVLINGESSHTSYIHPFIYSKLMQTKKEVLERAASCQTAVLREREASQLGASSSSGLCCNNDNLQRTSSHRTSKCSGVDLDQLVDARNMGILKLSPADEVEGELLYYQHRIISNAVLRKRISDDLISRVVSSLPQEMDAAGERKWDALLVSQYHHELKEARKQGRKERRHKEAQAVLAAATAAAAASSRLSSVRKDSPEDSSQQEDFMKMNLSDVRNGAHSHLNSRVKETVTRLAVARSLDKNGDSGHLASSDNPKDRPKTCDVCRRRETVLNPVLVCSSCKVAVHLDCYRSVKSTPGPWHCELCDDQFSSRGSGAPDTNSWEKLHSVAKCSLCGGTTGAFRKSVDGQWIHALCAEWVLESTYRRGQVNPIVVSDTVSKGVNVCNVCHHKHGVCLKCSYGHCQASFHPTCARSAGFFMTLRTNGGKLQHKAYCGKHSADQRAKADTQKHGIEEFKSLKQVRVELERLRLLCERINKREKLKRELVICSHDILASNRDTVLSALARHPFYQPEVSSESATTSIKGHTDGCKSGSELVQRSDDVTVDSSTVAGKRRVKIPVPVDNDRKMDDSSTSPKLYMLKPVERVTFSGKQIPKRLSAPSRNPLNDADKRTKHRKHLETFDKELSMTSDQASMKNQRLPKGFVYVPIRCISKDKS